MKKSILVAAIALAPVLFSAQAFAGDSTSTNVGGGAGGAGGSGTGGTGTGGTANGGTATATGGGGGQATNTIADGVASNQGVSNTSNFYGSENQRFNYSGGYKIKNTPDASLGGPASGPCNGFSGGLGFSGPGFAVGANTSTVDKGCEMRETARVAAMLGRMDLANAVLENIAIVQEALKAKAKRSDAPAADAAAPEKVSSLDKKKSDVQQMAAQKKAAEAAIGREVAMRRMQDEIRFTTLETMDQNNGKSGSAARKDQQTAQSAAPAAARSNPSAGSSPSNNSPSAAAKSEPVAAMDQSELDAEFKSMTAALQAAANADQTDADLSK